MNLLEGFLKSPVFLANAAKAMRTPSHYAFKVVCEFCGHPLAHCLAEALTKLASGKIPGGAKLPDSDLFECLVCGEIYRAEVALTRVGSENEKQLNSV